jgi:1-acyl-sn-glycerol-3-phosphate acyltransferase
MRYPPRIVLPLFRACGLALHLTRALLQELVLFRFIDERGRWCMRQHWAQEFFLIAGIDLRCPMPRAQALKGGALFVANHVSVFDIIAIQALAPVDFLAKSEVAQWPLIGRWASQRGTLFIERTSLRSTYSSYLTMRERLRAGRSVAYFPEGTTTDGRGVGRFHSGLFQSAIDTRAPVFAIALSYQHGDGSRATEAAFVGDMTLLRCLWNTLSSQGLRLCVDVQPLTVSAGETRKQLADVAQATIADRLDCPVAVEVEAPLAAVIELLLSRHAI